MDFDCKFYVEHTLVEAMKCSNYPFVRWSRTICAILVEGIKKKFCEIMVQEEMSFKDILFGALVALLFSGGEPFVQFY